MSNTRCHQNTQPEPHNSLNGNSLKLLNMSQLEHTPVCVNECKKMPNSIFGVYLDSTEQAMHGISLNDKRGVVSISASTWKTQLKWLKSSCTTECANTFRNNSSKSIFFTQC